MGPPRSERFRAVLFRTDASADIGTGHVMRCLAVAAALRRHGVECHFASRALEGHLFEAVRAAGCVQHVVAGDEDAAWVESLLPRLGRPIVVFDHYGLDDTIEARAARQAYGVVVIDDLADRRHACDVLVDSGLLPGSGRSYRGLVPDRSLLLAGPSYAPLRDEFARARPSLRPRGGCVENILVAFGGSDPTGETAKALDGIAGWRRSGAGHPDVRVVVVAGPSNRSTAALRDRFGAMQGVTLLERTSEMARLMSEADLAIGAGGTTSWERCALGLPSLVTVVADNQRMQADDLARLGAIRLVGTGATVGPESYAQALATCTPAALESMGNAAAALTDGGGAERIAGAILGLFPEGGKAVPHP
jgi:UDP-2,4-diacetamido-2,4,6-trideoxy-beta-L-altropyranose hydrolase